MNTGLNLQKEIQEQSATDHIFGAIKAKGLADDTAGLVTALYAWSRPIQGIYPRALNKINHCIISFRDSLRQYYPQGEVQRGKEDYSDCVTRGFINELEMRMNYLVDKKIFPESTIYWLRIHDYFIDDRIVLSNRIPAIMSGTTRGGNSLKSVIEWIRKNGIHPRNILSEEEKMTWAEYHNRNKVTQQMLELGERSLNILQINYDKVYYRDFPEFFDNFYWKIFDNYIDSFDGDFIKELAQNYIFLGYGYRLIIHSQEKEEVITQEITDDQVRQAYMLRPDLQLEFPAWNKFYSVTRPHYTIYDWAKKYGPSEMPEIFDKPRHKTYIYNEIWRWIKGLITN